MAESPRSHTVKASLRSRNVHDVDHVWPRFNIRSVKKEGGHKILEGCVKVL